MRKELTWKRMVVEEYVCVCKYSTVGMQATSRRAKTLIGQICYTRKTPIWRASGFWYNMRQFEHGSNLASVFG